jgi:succinate dehydrogenase/fumarate reductase iron-sulfur protein
MSIHISIKRYDPDKGGEPVWVDYDLPAHERTTVLEALMNIYENQDPTLAFRFGCRFDKCGLCAVEVNGKPRMACYTDVKEGMKIGPLAGMPVVRDLVIDRAAFFEALRELELYIPEQGERSEPQVMQQSEAHKKLLSCVECLACNATCPGYDFEKNPLLGPFVVVKLAQLHLDPRNEIDRRKQARDLGLGDCGGCRKCYCIHGINIRKQAVEVLVGEREVPNPS